MMLAVDPRDRIWQSKEHLAEEALLIAKISAVFKRHLIKFPIDYEVDGCISKDDKLTGLFECKRRYEPWAKFPEVIISSRKVRMGFVHLLAVKGHPEYQDYPIMFFVRYDDGDYYTHIWEHELRFFRESVFQAKNHPDYPEKVFWIPKDRFRRF